MKGFILPLLMIFSFSLADEFIENMIKKLDERWWNEGYIEPPRNYKVRVEWVTVRNGDVEIPMMVARPEKEGKFPGVLFLHGRRGLDDLFQLHAKRLAASGFVVVAPDLCTGRFIERFPIYHDPAVEDDPNIVLNYALSRKDIACFVGYYPHLQDPNRPEPMQVYRYHEDVEKIEVPVLLFVGREEQYKRLRPILMAVDYLKSKGGSLYCRLPGCRKGLRLQGREQQKICGRSCSEGCYTQSCEVYKGEARGRISPEPV